MIRQYVTAYVATGLAFALIDAVWLRTMYDRLYKVEIGSMLYDGLRWGPAISFYLLYITGIMVFAMRPAFASGRWQTALLYGALFGFFTYMTYDLTNHATLKVWSLKVTILDIIWGSLLTGAAASAGFVVTRALTRG
ncbi:MAG: DUF2177 family protein [Polymorphobacter sp.]